MKNTLSKIFITAMAVLVILGSFPVGLTAENHTSPFTVTAQAASKKIKLKKTKLTLTTGDTYTLKLLDKKGKTISASKVKWSSSSKKIAAVSSKGVIKGVKNGTATVTARYKNKKYTCKVTVKNASLSAKKKSLTAGASFTLTLKDGAGKKVSASKAKWSTSNKSVATVSGKGKVTSKKAGTVKITATYKGKKYTCTVTVKKPVSTKPVKGDPDNDDSKSSTVYRTPTGKRYHLDPQCGGKNSSATNKSEAISRGLTPCQKCAQ